MIGIITYPLTEEISYSPNFQNYNSYVEDSYVKFIESAGGRVVPIVYLDLTETQNNINIGDMNGLLIPHGISDEIHKAWLFSKLAVV